MKGKRKISLVFIFAGLLLIGYPLALTVETKMEEQSIKAAAVAESSRIEDPTPPTEMGQPQTINPSTNEDRKKQLSNFTLQIPSISLDVPVVEIEDLAVFERKINQLPAHYPGTPLPGQKGNIAIAGHVNGPAGYFSRLHELKLGDTIILVVKKQEYKYVVEKTFATEKDDWKVVDNTDYEAVTLTTCQRVGLDTSAMRFIVRGKRLN